MRGPLIDDVWQTGEGWPEGEVRILPDGGLDLIWTGSALQVAGPDRTARMVPMVAGPPACGVRFLPGASRAVFGIPGEAVVDAVVPAAEVLGVAAAETLATRLASAPVAAQPRVLAQWASSDARRTARRDPAVAGAATLLAADPTLRVTAIASHLGLSERQLRRRVLNEVGLGPKLLARILRLRRTIALADADATLSLADAAYTGGYVDQAHLGHECSALGGATAAVLLGR